MLWFSNNGETLVLNSNFWFENRSEFKDLYTGTLFYSTKILVFTRMVGKTEVHIYLTIETEAVSCRFY